MLTDRAPSPAPSRPLGRTALRLAVVAVVVAAVWFDVAYISPRTPVHDFFDLRVYRGAARWWLEGRPLYDFHLGHTHYGFTYPPFAAVCMLPMALLSTRAAELVHFTGSLALIGAITAWLVLPLARRHGWTRWFAVALALPVVLAMEPIRETLGFGQLNIVIFALVVGDVVAIRRGWAWAGVGIGLATALKLTPGLFVVYLLLTRRRRPAAVAAATFLGATLLAVAVDGRTSLQYWTSALWETSRVGRTSNPSNQSLLGVLARATSDETPDRRLWLVLVVVVLVVALRRAVRAARAGDELVGVTLVGLATCLVSPISWTHHLYWVVPAAVVLVDVAAGTRVHDEAPPWLHARPRAVSVAAWAAAGAVVAVFALSLMWFGTDPLRALPRHGPGALVDDLYAMVMLGLVVLLPVRAITSSAYRPTPRPGAVPLSR